MIGSNVALEPPNTREHASPATSARSRQALVVFVDLPASRLHRLLRPGFRHCFTLIDDGAGWVLVDPLKDRIEVRRLDIPPAFDLADFYVRRGHRVLRGSVRRRSGQGGIVLETSTCVAVVKRVLGIVSLSVQTPNQLFRYLRDQLDPPFRPVEEGS